MLAVWRTGDSADRDLERCAANADVPALWRCAATVIWTRDPDGTSQADMDAHVGS